MIAMATSKIVDTQLKYQNFKEERLLKVLALGKKLERNLWGGVASTLLPLVRPRVKLSIRGIVASIKPLDGNIR